MPDGGHLLVLDMETTGLDPLTCRVLEVAAVLVGADTLTELASFSTPVDPCDPAALAAAQADPIIGPMHEANGLFDALRAGQGVSLRNAELALLAMTDGHPVGSVALAGSGVAHFDLQIIRARMPDLAARLAYWALDAGPLRRAYALWGPTGRTLVDANASKTHRALEDVRCHLADLRAFRELFMRTAPDASAG